MGASGSTWNRAQQHSGIGQGAQQRVLAYDRAGDGHYGTISAFIKSMRGNDPDAALYWLATMIAAGEDPAFIARRIIIAASEDVGNAASFLLSDLSSGITGEILYVDCGYSIMSDFITKE